MGGAPSQLAAQSAENQAMYRARQSYSVGMPGLAEQKSGIDWMQQQGGEPRALQQAFGGARAGMLDAATLAGKDSLARTQQENRGASIGGNIGAGLATPSDMGSSIARAMYGSRLTEAMGSIEEQNKMMGMQLGQTQTSGSGALSALGSQLTAIPTMQNYNSSYANVLGALNLGASVYGGLNQAGAFAGNQPTGAAGYGNPFMGAGSTATVGFEGT